MFCFTLDRVNSYRKRVLTCVPISFMLVFYGTETACLARIFTRLFNRVYHVTELINDDIVMFGSLQVEIFLHK